MRPSFPGGTAVTRILSGGCAISGELLCGLFGDVLGSNGLISGWSRGGPGTITLVYQLEMRHRGIASEALDPSSHDFPEVGTCSLRRN